MVTLEPRDGWAAKEGKCDPALLQRPLLFIIGTYTMLQGLPSLFQGRKSDIVRLLIFNCKDFQMKGDPLTDFLSELVVMISTCEYCLILCLICRRSAFGPFQEQGCEQAIVQAV